MSITPLPDADFTPSMSGYSGQKPFRFWCQTVLPLVYDDSLSYYELLNKVVNYLNHTIEDVASVEDNVDALLTAYNQLQDYVNDYFSELDVQEEIDLKLDEMASSGELDELISPIIADATSSWLNENVTPVGSAVIVDPTLTISGAAADAKVTGDAVNSLKNAISDITGNTLLNFTDGKYIRTTAPVDISAPENYQYASYVVADCEEGDKFTVTGIGYTSSHYLWCFVDTAGGVLTHAESREEANHKVITAPSNAVNLVVNVNNTEQHSLYRNRLLSDIVDDLVADTPNNFKFMSALTESDNLDNVTNSGWYYWTSSHIPTGSPVNFAGIMFVNSISASNCTQIVYSKTTNGYVTYRYSTSSGFVDWIKIIVQNDLSDYIPTPEIYRFPDSSAFANALTADTSVKKYIELDETRNIVVCIESKYSGETQPKVRFQCYGPDRSTQFYYSPVYDIGSSNEYIRQSFRIPNGAQIGAYRITFYVPSGSTLTIRSFSCKYEDYIRKGVGSVIFHAHRGFDAIYPGGSYNSIVSASELGFDSCIVIPKFTSDGVAVSFHDDDSISGQMTQVDGSAIPTAYDLPVSQLTYAQLMQWSIGYSKNTVFADDKILKMDDFLRICAETGMRPIFSVHPVLTREQWVTLKGMLDKYGLTKYLSVKSANYTDVWSKVVDVFGNGNIHSIILLYSTVATYNILDYINTGVSASGLDLTKTRLDCEFFDQSLKSESIGTTQMAQLEASVAAGYTTSVVLGAQTTGNDMKTYMQKGVTEFTNGHHCSIGLNW